MVKFTHCFMEDAEILTPKQDKLVTLAIENVNRIVDLEKVREWCKKEKVKELMIYGSRAILLNRDDSDLDIMIASYNIQGLNDDNFIEKQREALKDLYNSFNTCVVDKSIELDFKLNTSEDEDYYGITYGEEVSDSGECDFHFGYYDIPSCILISKDGIHYSFAQSLKEIFDKESFII